VISQVNDCRVAFQKCLANAQTDLDKCLKSASGMGKCAQSQIDSCETIGYCDVAECGVRFTACGLWSLVPFAPGSPEDFAPPP
jgi:hypothetical protein